MALAQWHTTVQTVSSQSLVTARTGGYVAQLDRQAGVDRQEKEEQVDRLASSRKLLLARLVLQWSPDQS
jgi:hypothetical protein